MNIAAKREVGSIILNTTGINKMLHDSAPGKISKKRYLSVRFPMGISSCGSKLLIPATQVRAKRWLRGGQKQIQPQTAPE